MIPKHQGRKYNPKNLNTIMGIRIVMVMILTSNFLCIVETLFFVALPSIMSLTMASVLSFSFNVANCARISSNSLFSIALRFYSFDIFFSCSLILTNLTETFFVEMPMICPISS